MDSIVLRQRVLPLALFFLTLGLRVFALSRFGATPYAEPASGDMAFYAEWAQRIARGELTDFRAFYGQPLYAYLLGAIFSITGFEPLLISAIQAVLDALTSVLLYQIALLAFPDVPRRAAAIGVVAAAGWALFLPAATYSLLLIPASWLALGWWFSVWWLLRRSADARITEWFLVAAGVGAVTMISATVLFAVPLFLTRAAGRRSAPAALAVLLGVLGGTAPAWLHNTLLARDPVFLSAHSGVNFWIGNNPEANGFPRVPRELPSEQAALLRASIAIPEAAADGELKRSEVSAYWSRRARHFIAAQPAQWLRLVGLKMRNFWNCFVYDDLSAITALGDAGITPAGLSFGMLAVFGLPGCVVALRKPHARWIVAAVAVQLVALLPVFVNERYRMAAAPGLLLLAAWFLSELWNAVARLRWKRAAALLAVLAASTWLVTLPVGDAALLALDDYKTARRHLEARQFILAEIRMRRAFEPMVPASQLAAGVANGFAEVAQERLQAGDRATAVEIVGQAIRIDPANERHRELQLRLAE